MESGSFFFFWRASNVVCFERESNLHLPSQTGVEKNIGVTCGEQWICFGNVGGLKL